MRLRLRGWIARAIAAALLLLAGASLLAATPDDYQQLPGKKALAIAAGDTPVHGIAHGQIQDMAASLSALAQCRERRAAESAPCELVRLNDRRITTARELRDSLPQDPHPLYLWRYTANGATVYLAGSIHFLKESLYPLPEPFEAAFRQSDTLVLEVDISALSVEEQIAKTTRATALPEGRTLASALPDRLRERLSARLAHDGSHIDDLQAVNPAMVMNLLTVSGLMALGYTPDFGMEQYYLARKGDRAVLELEGFDAQLELLFGQPMAIQIQLLADTLDQEASLEPLLADLLRAWLSGADTEFLHLFEQHSGQSETAREFMRQLLDERNVGMAEQVARYLSGQGTYFVLVGAAHCIGEDGIVSLLQRRGLNGTRIMSNTVL